MPYKIKDNQTKGPTYPNGSYAVLQGYWQIVVSIHFCPCEDGKCRAVKISGQPDTAWTIPGSIGMDGKSVTGFVTCDEEGYKFIANKFGKNWGLMESAIKKNEVHV